MVLSFGERWQMDVILRRRSVQLVIGVLPTVSVQSRAVTKKSHFAAFDMYLRSRFRLRSYNVWRACSQLSIAEKTVHGIHCVFPHQCFSFNMLLWRARLLNDILINRRRTYNRAICAHSSSDRNAQMS